MYSQQLRHILGQIEPTTRAHFRGVFAIDELAQAACDPGSYVINLDRRDEPGSHWVAVYIDPTTQHSTLSASPSKHEPVPNIASRTQNLCSDVAVEYFDSYGKAATSPELITFLSRCVAQQAHQQRHFRLVHKEKSDTDHDTDTVGAKATAITERRRVWHNTIGLQPTFTGSCGFYCVYFIIHRAKGQAASDIVQLLSRIDSHHYVKSYVLDRYSLSFH